MRDTLEKLIEDRLVRWLKRNKIKWRRKAFGELLDRWIFLPNGHLFVIELKRRGGRLSPRQSLEIRELRELGYDIEVHDDAEEAIQAIRDRLEAARLSKEGDKVRAAKLLRGSVLRSWIREDKYQPRRREDLEERRAAELCARRSALESMLLRLAKGG